MHFLLLNILWLFTQGVTAHYLLSKLSHNGGPVSKNWQYVRQVTPGFLMPGVEPETMNPIYELYDDNIRCGRGAAMTGRGVETLAVSAGDEIGFVPTQTRNGKDRDVDFYHPGFAQAYLSRAPGDLESYTGDGDWFKVAYIGAKTDTEWAIQGHTMANFTLPKTTPPGKYLLRLEVIFGITHEFNVTQFYINCAHIEVNGPGGGKPGPMVKFPGAYDVWDHAIWAPAHVTGLRNLTGFVGPGPPVWEG